MKRLLRAVAVATACGLVPGSGLAAQLIPPAESTAARIEGSLGAHVGGLGLGISLGFDAQETRTLAAPVPRSIRSAAPAAVLGATWSPLGPDRLRLGVHGRWQRATHRINLFSLAAPTRVYELAGYREPRPIDVTATFYRRDIERTARAVGGGIAAGMAGTTVVLFGEVAETHEEHSSVEVNDPPRDTWAAGELRVGAVVHRTLLGDRLELHGSAVRSELDGRTRLFELDQGVFFTTDESALDLVLDTRLRAHEWLVGFQTTGRYRHRSAADSSVAAASELRSWTTGASAEVARRLGGGLSAGVGGAMATYRAAGGIPTPQQLGPVYRVFPGPELAIEATDAMTRAATVTLRWDLQGRAGGFYIRGRGVSAGPTASGRLPRAPAGETRSGWSIAVGFTTD